MIAKGFTTALAVLAGTLLPVSPGYSAGTAKISGGIAGIVTNPTGVPQMGATVILYNRFDRLLQRTLTDDKGTFGFGSLSPDVYCLRVSLSSFLPALKRNITVQPGMESLLNVNLATVFSSIELVAVSPGQSSIMSDEWRWVLRSSSATRPVLRLLPELKAPYPKTTRSASVFSDTKGLVKVSAGDQGEISALGTEPDLGTAFALATSFLGSNHVHVSGNLGYSGVTGAPTTAFRTSFKRDLAGGYSPEFEVTMRQLSLPRFGGATTGDAPMLRTLSATMLDSKQLTDTVRFEYGMALDTVTFLDRLSYASPFGRLTWAPSADEAVQIGFASGTPPAQAFTGDRESGLELQQDLSALAMFPRVSLRSGVARVQRMQTMEIGYHRKVGSRTFAFAMYRDDISNAALTVAGDFSGQLGGDWIPDVFNNTWTVNAGHYGGLGYMASMTQEFGSRLNATVAYGSGPALTVDSNSLEMNSIGDLRSGIRTDRRQSLTMRVAGTIPRAGTQFVASYQWANVDALNPAHMYLTERTREGLGLNFSVRQPIPYFGGLPGHVEANAELRNMLAQGYVPFLYGSRRSYLMQTARSVRGGLSFHF